MSRGPSRKLGAGTTDGGRTGHKSYSGSGKHELLDIACPGSIGGNCLP